MRLQTFTRTNRRGQVPAGTWVAFYREEDEAWIAHRLKEDYTVSKVLLLSEADHGELSYQSYRFLELCGWAVARTDDADYPLIAFDVAGTHFFPRKCANDPDGTMNAPKEKPLTPAWKRKRG